jgi:hypothetical protein
MGMKNVECKMIRRWVCEYRSYNALRMVKI